MCENRQINLLGKGKNRDSCSLRFKGCVCPGQGKEMRPWWAIHLRHSLQRWPLYLSWGSHPRTWRKTAAPSPSCCHPGSSKALFFFPDDPFPQPFPYRPVFFPWSSATVWLCLFPALGDSFLKEGAMCLTSLMTNVSKRILFNLHCICNTQNSRVTHMLGDLSF